MGLRQLGGGMVCGQERVVLQGPWKGLPRTGRRLRSCRRRSCSLRLQRGLCQLDGGMECSQEGLVLQECWQGLPPPQLEVVLESLVRLSEWCTRVALAPAPSSGDTLNMHPLTAKFALRRADIWTRNRASDSAAE